ncbi:hypothetical protein BGS_0925 [Beggiatoa sp. SS]|nr:hypothetical protein BGS_0925 [Beggiatoa sp. SS]
MITLITDMNPFIQKLVDDLKTFSSELLLPGLHATQQVSTNMGTVPSTTALLKSIDFLTNLIPHFGAELQTTDNTPKILGALYPLPPNPGPFFPRNQKNY